MMQGINLGEIGKVFDEVALKIPKLINSLLTALYSPEAGKSMGQAVGNLYKELIESGIPEDEALNMAKDYIQTLKSLTEKLK